MDGAGGEVHHPTILRSVNLRQLSRQLANILISTARYIMPESNRKSNELRFIVNFRTFSLKRRIYNVLL